MTHRELENPVPRLSSPLMVVSTCGTSLLTHGAGPDIRRALAQFARRSSSEGRVDLGSSELDRWIAERVKTLRAASPDVAATLCAEIHAIEALYATPGVTRSPTDHHVLLHSDTHTGAIAASAIAAWLSDHGLDADLHRVPDLRADSEERFHAAMACLEAWCESTLTPVRAAGTSIVFCLSGGFKAFQGTMQSLAAVYADAAAYIFESGGELIWLPGRPTHAAEG